MTRCVLWLSMILALLAPGVWAANTHGTSDPMTEQQAWWGDGGQPYLVAGCVPTVPVSSATFAAFACAGYVRGANGALVYMSQPAHALGPLTGGDGTTWLALHRDTTTTVAGWARQAGTSYLWKAQSTRPVNPPAGIIFAAVTVNSGLITAVQPTGATNPQGLVVSLADRIIAQGDDPAVNAAPLLQRALTRLQSTGGTLYAPNGTYLIDNARVTYMSTHPLTIQCASQDAIFKWGTYPDDLPPATLTDNLNRAMVNLRGVDGSTPSPVASVEVHGCTFDMSKGKGTSSGAHGDNWSGLSIFYADHVSVTHSKFLNGSAEMLRINQFFATGANYVGKYVYVADSHFENWNQDAINPTGLETRILNNSFKTGVIAVESARGYGVFSGNTLENLDGGLSIFNPYTITNNRFQDCGLAATGIAAASVIDLNDGGYGQGFSDTVITHNTFYNGLFAGSVNVRGVNSDRVTGGFYNDRVVMSNNSFFGQGIAIVLQAVRKAVVSHNVIHAAAIVPTVRGISVGDAVDTLIEGNDIPTNGGTEQYIYDTQPWDATANNLIAWNFVGQLGWVWGLTDGPSVTVRRPTLALNSLTPNVKNMREVLVSNTVATNITNFLNGTDGQTLTILATNGNTQLIHGATTLVLKGGADAALSTGNIISLLKIGTIWYEISRSF